MVDVLCMDYQRVRWLRWAFNCKHWKPTASEWIYANKCIQREEIQRIEQFVFQAPAISSLVGRLLLRKSIQTVTGVSNAEIKLSRTAEGRPFVAGLEGLDVNVSHHGDWVVLALESDCQVGIDVMSLDRPINIELDEYFRLMRKQFTEGEWGQIEKSPNKLNEFYRFWCLKESYVKATGVGLNLNLQTIDFVIKDKLSAGVVATSTAMSLKDESCEGRWLFEETLLDDNHCVAVCTGGKGDDAQKLALPRKVATHDKDLVRFFTILNRETLLNIDPITDNLNSSLWNQFTNKKFSAR